MMKDRGEADKTPRFWMCVDDGESENFWVDLES